MPREIVTTVYSYGELTSDAQAKAIESVCEMLVASWDSDEIEAVGQTMVYTLAEKLRSPGWDTYGPVDFPGIDGVTLDGWDLERGQYLVLSGHLDRDNAPALPWADGVESVRLDPKRDYTVVWAEPADDAPWPETAGYISACEALVTAVKDAMHAAWVAGRDESEYLTGEEYAREWIDGNEPEFDESGSLA